MSDLAALQLARYIVRQAQDKGEPITNLKLHKLLYYAQGWHLAFFNEVLFDDPIEAWVHGPVVPSVYRYFKGYGFNPIPIHPKKTEVSKKIANFLEAVLLSYLPFDAFTLEKMTHLERPWKETRGSLLLDEPCRKIISIDTMRDFFKKIYDDAKSNKNKSSP